MTIRMLIVDDSDMVRDELRNVLELTGKVRVVGEASDGTVALELIETLKPNIVLIDLETTGTDGLEITRRIKTRWPAQKVAVLTFYASESNLQKALDSGADAFIVKGTDLRMQLHVFESLAGCQEDASHCDQDTVKGDR